MSLGKREPSGREKDEAAVEQLAQLRERLHVDDISKARKAAFNLSWMQEDGLEILTEALFGNFQRTTKKAAAYGLRSMHGRMKKLAEETLTRGLSHDNRITKEACAKALLLMKDKGSKKKGGSYGRRRSGKPRIKEFRRKGGPRSPSPRRNRPSNR